MLNLNVGLVSAVLLFCTTNAYAMFADHSALCPHLDTENIVSAGYTIFDDSCNEKSELCDEFGNYISDGGDVSYCSASVMQEEELEMFWRGDGMISVDSCWVEVVNTYYSCAPGYYGTATGCDTGCTVCPSNATCSGGNYSTFVCNGGYYKSGASCVRCPQHSSSGNYGSSSSGAISNTGCYIGAGTTWTFNDTKGSGSEKFPSTCYYSN
ncbi:MAG: hypothetical protein IKW09_01005 [Alphaproteobacteria bacterium]|nr:hypothetical protein [Alphaproteobacteria bacterium]